MDDGSDPLVCLVGTAPPRRCGIATFTESQRMSFTLSWLVARGRSSRTAMARSCSAGRSAAAAAP